MDAPRRYIFVKFLTARVNTFFMFVTFFDCNCLVYGPRKKTVRTDCNVSLARVKRPYEGLYIHMLTISIE